MNSGKNIESRERIVNIYGIGNPLIDILANIDDEDLRRLSLHKGTMHLIDRERHTKLISYLKDKPLVYSPGGSCPNTMVTLRMLGVNTTLAGSVILLTEDKERTMNTYLGANRCFNEKDVNLDSLKKAGLFYFTGYMWDTEAQKGAIRKALTFCKENGGSTFPF